MNDLTFRCRSTVDGERCDFAGTRQQLTDHATELDHATCVLCGIILSEYEQQVCSVRIGKERRATCVEQLDVALGDILDAYATLPTIIEKSGYHQGALPGGNALVLLVDGSVTGGGPDDDMRYHDPVPVLAQLYEIERWWAQELDLTREARGDATVTSTIAWLRDALPYAARNYDEIVEVASEIRTLRSRLQHAAGLADDPEEAPAECFDCGGRLRRVYRPLRETVAERLRRATQWTSSDDRRIAKHVAKETRKHPGEPPRKLRISSRATRVRQAAGGDDREGLADTWTCGQCHRSYDQAEYRLALRMRANSITGWVTIRVAAETLRRHPERLRRWAVDQLIPSACSVMTRQLVVDWEATKAHSDSVQRRQRDRGGEEAAS